MMVTCGAQETAVPELLLHSFVSGVGFSSDRGGPSEVASGFHCGRRGRMAAPRASLSSFYCLSCPGMSFLASAPDSGAIPGVLGTLKHLSWHTVLSFDA